MDLLLCIEYIAFTSVKCGDNVVDICQECQFIHDDICSDDMEYIDQYNNIYIQCNGKSNKYKCMDYNDYSKMDKDTNTMCQSNDAYFRRHFDNKIIFDTRNIVFNLNKSDDGKRKLNKTEIILIIVGGIIVILLLSCGIFNCIWSHGGCRFCPSELHDFTSCKCLGYEGDIDNNDTY